MNTRQTIISAALLLAMAAPAMAQDVATPAGTDVTGTSEVGIQSTGTREMATGASGNSGVVGRGIGHQSANADTNRDMPAADTSPAPTPTASTPAGDTTAAAKHPRHPHRSHPMIPAAQ